jgi:colicin import membrane protein
MIVVNQAQRLSAGALALMVHGLFFLALIFSVSWRALPDLPVYADLWNALPPLPEAAPINMPAPEVAPAIRPPAPEPEAPKPIAAPVPKPVPEAPPVPAAKPDISLRAKTEAKPVEEKPTQQDKERETAFQAEEQRRREAERQAAEARRQAMEQARRELDRELAQVNQDEMAREMEQLRRGQQSRAQAQAQVQAQSTRSRLILEHRDFIRAQIHQHLRPCQKMPVDTELVFTAQLLPSGDLKRLQRVKSSGSAACDEDVERAIVKAFPMPLPPDREAARAFTREPLELRLRPNETPPDEGRG